MIKNACREGMHYFCNGLVNKTTEHLAGYSVKAVPGCGCKCHGK